MSIRPERILEYMELNNISYGELSKMTGIAKSALQRYAIGETSKVPIDRIEKIAHALGIEPAYIIGWIDKPNITDNSQNSYDNHGVIGDVNGGAVTIKNGRGRPLTTHEQDMLRIYNESDGKTQMQIMNFIYEIEEKNNKTERTI